MSQAASESYWSDMTGLIKTVVHEKGPLPVLAVLIGADILKAGMVSRSIDVENYDVLLKWMASAYVTCPLSPCQ